MLHPITRPRATLIICLSLILATLAVYWQVFHFEFLTYDDPYYITDNTHVQGGLTWANICWAFTTNTATNWHPLTWISHMIDWEMYGANSGGHHFTNLLFHIANTLLVFVLLNRLTGTLWRSAAVAALFALHPLHVESVAWVSERKDVLSTFFGFLTIWAYLRYTQKRRLARYLCVLALFALSLMSKPTLVTLPILLLLLDFWPLQRISSFAFRVSKPAITDGPDNDQEVPLETLLREKCPMLILSAISSVVTMWAQQEAISGEARLPLVFRLCNVALSYCRYIKNTLWPTKLVINYPYPKIFYLFEIAVAVILLVMATVWVLRHAKSFPYLFTGWFWFLGALVPTIGIIQVGLQSMADRYTYVPSIGLFIIAVWGGYDLATRRQIPPLAMFGAAALAIAACVPLSIAQVYCWRNSVALYEHAIQLRPDNFVAEYDLATTLAKQGDLNGAQRHFERCLELTPNSFMAHNSLGQMLAYQGRFEEAVPHFYDAMRVYPAGATAEVHCDLANALEHLGRTEEAITQYQLALKEDPQAEDALNNFAWILATNPDDGIRNGREAVRLAEHACEMSGS